MATTTYGAKDIRVAPELAMTLPAMISGTAGATIKAGTPLTGDLTKRDSSPYFVKATGANANAVLLHDVVIGTSPATANGTIIINGTVDLLKYDSTTASLITSDVITALAGKINFIKGAK